MIINSNIPALNTYRQLGINQNATQNSMEKLSSGLRINRAGDDAAGLAISEKMRAQIRGLDQASRNAADGISMIQTAEGALNETHSILQRMRELATQASNDTNVDIDREEIQKEMNQLTSEINRIGNTTEFNTQNLLDGGQQIDSNAEISGERLSGGSGIVTHNIGNGSFTDGDNATSAQYDAVNYTLNTNLNTTLTSSNHSLEIDVDGVIYELDDADLKSWDGSGDAAAAITLLEGATRKDGQPGTLADVVNITDDGSKLSFETQSTNGLSSTIDFSVNGDQAGQITTALGIANNDNAVGIDATKATERFDISSAEPTEGSTFSFENGQTIGFWDSTSGNFSSAEEAKTAMSADHLIDVNGTSGPEDVIDAMVAFSSDIDGYTLSKTSGTGAAGTTHLEVESDIAGALGTTSLASAGADVASARPATGDIQFTDAPTEGSSITIGDQTIGFYDSSLDNFTNDVTAKENLGTDFVLDVNGLSASETVDEIVKLNTDINTSLDKDVTLSKELVADGSVKLNVSAASTGLAGNLIELGTNADSTTGFSANFQIGANTGQSMTIQVNDMRAQALGISGNEAGAEIESKNGSVASYVSTENVTNGTDNAKVEFALDVSSSEKASAAISVVNDAIEEVSSQRSNLGAFQNRLEHTISNLDNSSENLTAAESRIRDVDMAKEMMEMTRANILSQASQSMLAQANNTPQSVLQLLG